MSALLLTFSRAKLVRTGGLAHRHPGTTDPQSSSCPPHPSAHHVDLVDFFHRAPLRSSFGMEISFNAQGAARFETPDNPRFDPTMGGVDGGVIVSMIDKVGGFTAAAQTGRWVSTADVSVRVLQPAAKTLVRSQGRLVRAGTSISVFTVEVHTEAGDLFANGSGTYAVSSTPRAAIG